MAKKQPGPKKQPKGNYEIGYCRPPVAGQIQHGEKRNPFGKNGKPLEIEVDDPLQFGLARKTKVVLDGEEMYLSAETAMDLKHIAAAMAGNVGSYNAINRQRSRRPGSGPCIAKPTPEELAEEKKKEMEQMRPIIDMLELQVELKKQGIIEIRDGDSRIAPLVLQLMMDHILNNPDAMGGGNQRDNWLRYNRAK